MLSLIQSGDDALLVSHIVEASWKETLFRGQNRRRNRSLEIKLHVRKLRVPRELPYLIILVNVKSNSPISRQINKNRVLTVCGLLVLSLEPWKIGKLEKNSSCSM